MSTLVATTLQDRVSAKRISMEMSIDGTPKAFINFSGITNVVNVSMNVTSLTDVGVGQWYPTYTATFASAWSIPSGSVHNSGVFWGFLSMIPSGNATSCYAVNMATPSVPADASHVGISTCGRLA